MNRRQLLPIGVLLLLLTLGVWLIASPSRLQSEGQTRFAAVRAMAAAGVPSVGSTGQPVGLEAITPVVVNLGDIPPNVYDPNNLYDRWLRGEADLDENEYRVSPQEVAALQQEALALAPSTAVQIAESGPGLRAPVLGVSFDSLDRSECCGGGSVVPPDPIMAAGPNHLIAIVNLAFEIYDKTGTSLAGPTTMASFFAPVGTGCAAGPFDPNVVYDEEEDRWVIAADGDGTHYCIAVSQTSDPLGAYNIYSVPAQPVGGEFHDYPHTGVGDSYIVAGANQFGGGIPGGFEGRVWAMDKAVMYAGGALTPVTFSTGGLEGTPQPLHLHGFDQGTWPSLGSTHYFATDPYDGCTVNIWQWNIPAAPTIVSTYDLCVATGVTSGMPVSFPQSGGSNIQANDFRMREFEYRNGYGWIADSIACNPGGGTVDCVRWHQVDLSGTPALVQAGVYASNGEYRTFPDLAVNHCDDMVVGYTKSSSATFPGIWYTGRESGDPAGTLQAEAELKAGEITYTAFDPAPHRWGDYTGMTIDPDGLTFWYLGEYSKNITGNARWGNYIGSFTYPDCTSGAGNPSIVLTKTVGIDTAVCATTDAITVTVGTDVTYCFEVENTGDVTLNFHDLDDSELGNILSGLPYALAPGASAFITETTTIMATTINTATWTAYNPAGYTYDDTAPYNFIDISGTGTALNLTDDGEANVTMPFQFTYFGVSSDLVRIGNNGGIRFNTTTGDIAVANAALPNGTHPLTIFPFWDDIDADTGNVYYETQGSAPNRQFIVQWHDRPHFSNTPGHTTFQAILFEGTNEILFQYADVDFDDPQYDWGASATVGLNESVSSAMQYSFNTPVITNSMAILWTPSIPGSASATDSATVTVLIPEIDVDPAEIAVTQAATSTVSYPLTISNIGAGDLNWDIAEEAAQAANGHSVNSQARQVAGLGDGNGTAQEEASTASSSSSGVGAPANTPIFAPTGNVLYDNGPLVNSPGTGVGGADESVLQTVSLGMNTLGFGHQVLNGNRMADDFTIPPGSNWTIDEIVFYAYQTGSPITSTITQVNLRIWDGEPGNGGTVIWGDTSTNILVSTIWSGIYRVTETTTGVATDRPIMASTVNLGGLSLSPGTYWLDWQSDGTLASGPWAPPVTVNGQTTTGNGLQSVTDNGVTWAPALDTGTGTPQQGLPFLIMGSSGCSSDIAWASVSPTSGTTAGGDSSEVMVTFDTTGLTVGSTYTGTLCVNSNDPVTPLVRVPLTLTVEAQSFGVEVATADADLSGDAGTTVTYTVWITNTGNVEDTFALTATGVWTATPSVVTVTVAAGGTTSVMVTVDIPVDADDGDMDVTTFTATSQSDDTATASVDLTTTAVVADTTIYIYLPIIMKP